MTLVVIVLVILTLLAGYIVNLGYNRKRVVDAASGTRAKIYFRAQAGIHDATARIRKNYTGAQFDPGVPGPEAPTPALTPAGSFLDPAYNPDPYLIDVDADGVMDTQVNIGAEEIHPVLGPRRAIVSAGLADP